GHGGGEGGADHHEDHGDEENLAAARADDEPQERGDREARGDENRTDGEERDARHLQELQRGGAPPIGEERDEHHHGNDAQILEDQDGQGELCGRSDQLAPLREDPQDNRGAGEGQKEPENQGLGPPEVEGQAGEKGQHGGAENLERPADDHLPAHAGEPRDGELDADREEQENHADFGEGLHVVAAADEPDSVRAEDGPGGEKSHHHRKAESLEEEDDGDREGEDDEQFPQQRRWLGHPSPS